MTRRITISGTIRRNGKDYIFRSDHAHGDDIWAWEVHGGYDRGTVNKWCKMPAVEAVTLFDIDNPPQTVSYQPLLD